MSTMFRDAAAKQKIEAAYELFREKLPSSRSHTVATRYGETHVLSAGREGAPPLVVLHGALASSAHVIGELADLLDQFHVFAPDIVGQSVKSEDRRIDVEGPAYGEWLVDVLDGLGLEKAHVFGVSWGGFVARRLAEVAPRRIDRLVLLVPAGVVSGPAWRGFTALGLPLMLYRMFPSEARLRRFASALLTTMDESWIAYFGEAFQAYKLDMRVPPLASAESLARFDRPTLVLAADADVSFPGAALVERARILFPHAETELLKGCKHAPPTDAVSRSRLAARVGRFLRGENVGPSAPS